ncbi:influenza virus NS1A-binding protein homolog A isoform X1 [Zeugodacus cucurbitae]|uniref:Kelch-like protein 1 n=2 Tax=Zeugodacus cucurbitae TaxID=28588 RepID=A0A0A1WNW1_ZEUCU|nr:influenza virus NS1A-binding protein homolog A isoform X1 [Zeugodacus cucurbitae]XP_054087323.1 influenza virus NS1A-binding protein homolog A isoform X1 [Zeugodacus cucurbitae]XP_054087324.1 influenza virus NS1A-binding protein homolog A isoform X1 [Zeugodacus cucurbitae]XP_054087326.1 influenza virus NS1A-binding protein homolog A isoform X1 [Zeugodacus cucurbitae]
MEKVWIQCGVLKFPKRSPSLVYSDKHLISLGGFSDDETPSNGVFAYSLQTEEWKTLKPMSVPRVDLCVVIVNKFIYVLGESGSNPCVALKTAEKFNHCTRQWISLPDMFMARSQATAVALDDQIYIMGGLASNGRPLKSVECFNTITGKWDRCGDMIQPRFDFGAAFFKGLLYVIGSGNTMHSMHSLSCSVECYNPKTNTWSQAASINVPRYGICGITLTDRLMAIGGTTLTDFKGIIEVYKPTKNSWLQGKPLPMGGNYRCFVVPSKELTEIQSKPNEIVIAPKRLLHTSLLLLMRMYFFIRWLLCLGKCIILWTIRN